jgi:hypothetical protein
MKFLHFSVIATTASIFLSSPPIIVLGQSNKHLDRQVIHKYILGNKKSQVNRFALSKEELLNHAREVARILSEEYPGWKDRLDACPCTQIQAANDRRFESSYTRILTKQYHPGAEYEYRSTKDRVQPYLSKKSPDAPKLMPGQQCIYDDAGNLITHGPGAGTPDAYSPSVTFPGQGLVSNDSHTYWDVEPFDNGLKWREYQYTWTPNKGNSCKYINRIPNSCKNTKISFRFITYVNLSSKKISEIELYSDLGFTKIAHFGMGGDRVMALNKLNAWYFVRYERSGICGWVNKDYIQLDSLPSVVPTNEDMEYSIIAMRQENPNLFNRAVNIIKQNLNGNVLKTFEKVKEEIQRERSKIDFNMGEDETSAIDRVDSNMYSGGLSNGLVTPKEKQFQSIVLQIFINVDKKSLRI